MSETRDEHAALKSMFAAYEQQFGPCDEIEDAALSFAWQARGEYERERDHGASEQLAQARAEVERLRAELALLQAVLEAQRDTEADLVAAARPYSALRRYHEGRFEVASSAHAALTLVIGPQAPSARPPEPGGEA